MAAKFVAEQGTVTGQELELEGGTKWTLGRDPDACEIVIEDPTVSRKHLLCRTTPQGISVENLNTSNPILVNDEVVEEPQILHHGDTVRVGEVLLRFYEEERSPVMQKDSDKAPEASGGARDEREHEGLEELEETDSHDTILSDEDLEDARTAHVAFDPTSGRRFVLKVISGPNSGAEVGLETSREYLIGTDANSCDVTFHDISVSHHHAKLRSLQEGGSFEIEDLKSRNGVYIDGVQVRGAHAFAANEVVALGTSAFVIYDKERESNTIVSPLRPTEEKLFKRPEPVEPTSKAELETALEALRTEKRESSSALGSLITLGIVTALLVIVGAGVVSLFQSQSVDLVKVDKSVLVDQIMAEYPSVISRYNPAQDRLLLLGHLLTQQDRTALTFKLQELRIRDVTNNVYIDEVIWHGMNEQLGKRPGWRSLTMHSPVAGRFVLTGFLRTRAESETLNTFLTQDFEFINNLDNQVIVEENILNQIDSSLKDKSMNAVTVEFSNGEITLAGNVSYEQGTALQDLLKEFEKIHGVKVVRNFVVEASPSEAMINLTGQYSVTGFSERAGTSVNVVINGKILQRGDKLDGMTIISIRPNAIFLERDNVRYRIDYNQ